MDDLLKTIRPDLLDIISPKAVFDNNTILLDAAYSICKSNVCRPAVPLDNLEITIQDDLAPLDNFNITISSVPTEIGAEFDRDGRRWRVSVVTDHFIIATGIRVAGEPELDTDTIKVML